MDQQQPLVCPSHTTQYIGAVIIGIIVGAGASFVYFKQAPASIGGGTYQDGFDTAKKRVLESPMGNMFRVPDDIRTLAGPVTAVDGTKITLRIQSLDPFSDPSLSDRIVVVTNDTKITKIEQGDTKAFQLEMDAFMKKMKESRGVAVPSPMPPAPIKKTVSATSIVVGSNVIVTSTENIKEMKEFSASEIQIQ